MKVKNVKDYYNSIQELFPDLKLEDIKRILNFGFKSLYLHNLYGGDTCIHDNNFWMYTGTLTTDSLKYFEKYKKKLALKLRILDKRLKRPWNGYYYFAILDKLQQKIENQKNKKGRKRKKFDYGTVMLYKLLDECKIKESNKLYIYKIPYTSDCGYCLFKENLTSDKAELIIKREPQTFNDILTSNNNYGRY